MAIHRLVVPGGDECAALRRRGNDLAATQVPIPALPRASTPTESRSTAAPRTQAAEYDPLPVTASRSVAARDVAASRVREMPGSGLRKAIEYMGNLWKGLLVFLDDPRVPLHNNASERSLRGPVIGRVNHFGSRSKRGTEAAAILYSLVESAKLAGVDPNAYLEHAACCALRGEVIPLPHETAAPVAATPT